MRVLKWTSCSVQVDIFPPFSPPLINWPVHRTFPGLRHCIYPYPPKNSLIFFSFPRILFLSFFAIFFPNRSFFSGSLLSQYIGVHFFFYPSLTPRFFVFFMLMFLFILFFTSDCFRVCRGKTRVGRKSRMNEGGRAEKKEGRRDTVDGRTLFCIASLMAISMIFFSAENIKSLRYLLQSQSGNDLPGNLHGENFLLLPFLLLLLFFA